MLSAGGLLNAALSLLFGALADRYGARIFLIIHQTIVSFTSLLPLFFIHPFFLGLAALTANLGRGQNGAAGPFASAESSWLAETLPVKERGSVYSLNAAIGFFGMGAGALLSGLLPLWQTILHGSQAYRPLFLLPSVGSAICAILLSKTPGGVPHKIFSSSKLEVMTDSSEKSNSFSYRPLILLCTTNAFNGIAIGMTSPLIAYWFAAKFHAGPSLIGPVLSITFILTGLSSLFTGTLTKRIGLISSIVSARLLGLVMLIALPLAPTYNIAAILYMLRSTFSRGTAGARQAFALSLIPVHRRALGISLNNVSSQLPSAIGPWITGLLIQNSHLSLPFYIAAGLQAIYLILYTLLFRKLESDDIVEK